MSRGTRRITCKLCRQTRITCSRSSSLQTRGRSKFRLIIASLGTKYMFWTWQLRISESTTTGTRCKPRATSLNLLLQPQRRNKALLDLLERWTRWDLDCHPIQEPDFPLAVSAELPPILPLSPTRWRMNSSLKSPSFARGSTNSSHPWNCFKELSTRRKTSHSSRLILNLSKELYKN